MRLREYTVLLTLIRVPHKKFIILTQKLFFATKCTVGFYSLSFMLRKVHKVNSL